MLSQGGQASVSSVQLAVDRKGTFL